MEKSQNALVRGSQLCTQLSIFEGSITELLLILQLQLLQLLQQQQQLLLLLLLVLLLLLLLLTHVHHELSRGGKCSAGQILAVVWQSC